MPSQVLDGLTTLPKMKVVVLPQELHDSEIHTLDINCANDLVATGGKDTAISIWNLLDLTSVKSVDREALLKIVPQQKITPHNSTVKVLRWCPTNKLVLISGANDGLVYMSNLEDKSDRLIFPWPLKKNQKEAVIDGSWSADGRLFAWSTNDGKVHLFDTAKDTYQELTTDAKDQKVAIQRSIAFDPTNNYFVTVGDDTFVNVYQYQYDSKGQYQFKILSKISKLMNNNATVSAGINYRRVSWSCDGEYFSVPNASKQLCALISLLARSLVWGNKISLVGHDMECEVVKFAPQMFLADPHLIGLLTQEPHLYHVIASAGSDRTLVLWNTTKEAPLVVLRDTVTKAITDLVWDHTGHNLLFVSLDGHMGIVQFEPNELGYAPHPEVLSKLKNSQTQYIKPFVTKSESEASSVKKSKSLVEIIDEDLALKIEEAFAMKNEQPEPEKEPTAAATATATAAEPEVIEEKEKLHTGDVTPVVLAPTENVTETDDILGSAMTERANTSENGTPRPAKSRTTKAAAKTPAVQKVTTKDGKKRIQPVLISNGDNNTASPVSGNVTTSRNLQLNGTRTPKLLMEFNKPSYSVSEEIQKDNKRRKASDDQSVAKKPKRDLEPVRFVGSVIVNPSTSFAKIRLSVPKTRMSFRLKARDQESFILDIRNGQGNEAVPARVTYFKNEQQVWCDFIPRYIQLAAEGRDFWAVTTADGQILTYSHTSGKRLLPPIVLGSSISFLESHSQYLMAVTSLAEIYVWDMDKKKLHMSSPTSLASLLDLNNKYQEDVLSKADNITMCSITSKGIPLVTISNGSGYLYNLDMETWHTVSEAWWAFGSHYWNSITDDKVASEPQMAKILGKDEDLSILGLLEHKTNEEILRKSRVGRGKYFNKISKNMIMKEGFENLENNISLSHLENRILCCELLGERKDFHEFLVTYTKRICELGMKAKLFETCQRLLEPGTQGLESSNGVSTICGYNRTDLLKEIILLCAEYRDAQRILVHFSKKLGMIEGEY